MLAAGFALGLRLKDGMGARASCGHRLRRRSRTGPLDRRRPQARAPSWLSPMANVIHAPAIDRQHLGRDEAGIRLDQESHGGGNVLRRANPTDHGALAH